MMIRSGLARSSFSAKRFNAAIVLATFLRSDEEPIEGKIMGGCGEIQAKTSTEEFYQRRGRWANAEGYASFFFGRQSLNLAN